MRLRKSKIVEQQPRKTPRLVLRTLPAGIIFFLALIIALAITSCANTDPEDENGTIGTGILLEGTVSHSLLAPGSFVDAVSSDGKSRQIPINAEQQFSTTSLPGVGPWMLRVRVSADREIFGIAYADGTRNINAFSDVSLRRWFAQNSLRIDQNFDLSDRLVPVPTQSEYDASVSSIVQLIDLVLASYNVTGSDIISTKYDANDSGIDKFLRRNTVVIENELFTFQLTNPDNGIQAETASPTELASNSIDNGSVPSEPGSLRALSDEMDDIVLIWEPSTDDTSVVGYEVYRDQVLIGTTPYPQFIDANLDNNQTYSYTIVAFDSAGNSSAPSAPVSGTTTVQSGDSSIQLTPPTMLQKLSATSSTIRLSWNPPAAPNIASYNVYRGVKDNTLTLFTLIQRVSVPRATDTAVAINETYCYQVESVNAAGVASSRSEEICIDARSASFNSDGADGSTGLPDDRWKVPDLNVLDCSEVLSTEAIAFGLTTISEGCYSVPQTLTVPEGATLKLNEGVILKFSETAKLYVEGALTILGTLNNPVVLTGESDVRGSWGGVHFAGTRSTENLIRGTVIQYVGAADENGRTPAAITSVVSGLFSGPRFSMEDSVVRYSEGSALALTVANTRIDSFEGNLIYDNASVGTVVASAVHALAGNSQFIENTINRLSVNGRLYIGTDIVIPNLGITIRWGGITIQDGSLTIMPGVDLEIEGSALADVEGPVTVVGDAERPITLRGRYTDAQGTWNGFRLHGPGDKLFDHVNIKYGGVDEPETGAIEIDCTNNNRFRVQINNTEITDSASWGIFLKGSNCETEIGDNVTYWNNARGDSNIP